MENYSLKKISNIDLNDAVLFCISTYYNIYKNHLSYNNFNKDFESALEQEIFFFHRSIYYALYNNNKIIGTIRSYHWDSISKLPGENIFAYSIENILPDYNSYNVWHVGRFCIKTDRISLSLSHFKLMMMYAIKPICESKNGIMFAECDERLMKVLNLLKIKTNIISQPITYIGSKTFPIVSSKEDLFTFYNKNKLYKNIANS
jgi:hypothetical protein